MGPWLASSTAAWTSRLGRQRRREAGDALTRLRMQDLFGRLRARHGFAALLVTHDVDEALLLADRALVLDGGRIAEELPVPLAHPRAPDDAGFGPLRRQLLDRLGVPVRR